MYYFKAGVPRNADGTIATYSPGWHGTMPRCPNGVVVDLYNDKEGFLIAHTDDEFVPKEVKVLDEKEALAIVTDTKNEPMVYFGEKIADLWDSTKVCFKGYPTVEAVSVVEVLDG